MASPSAPPSPRRTRPELPRLVDQMRILTWFQFFLTVATLTATIVIGAILSGQGRLQADSAREQLSRVELLMLSLTGTAVALAVAAFLTRRGFAAAAPLVLIAEVAVLANVWLAVRAGAVIGALVLLLTVLAVWVLVNLFRREVWSFLMSSRRT